VSSIPATGVRAAAGSIAPSWQRRVMEKLGMTHDPADDFAHPALPEGHVLRRHVLYRIARPSPRPRPSRRTRRPA